MVKSRTGLKALNWNNSTWLATVSTYHWWGVSSPANLNYPELSSRELGHHLTLQHYWSGPSRLDATAKGSMAWCAFKSLIAGSKKQAPLLISSSLVLVWWSTISAPCWQLLSLWENTQTFKTGGPPDCPKKWDFPFWICVKWDLYSVGNCQIVEIWDNKNDWRFE